MSGGRDNLRGKTMKRACMLPDAVEERETIYGTF